MKIVIIICLVAVLGLQSACSLISPSKPTLPSIKLLQSDSATIVSTDQLPAGKISVLLYFSPDCEHCQRETISLQKSMDSLKNVNLCFITFDPLSRMKAFYQFYKLDRYPNITMGRDYNWDFARHYPGATPPFLVIYDAHRVQKGIFNGETKASNIIGFINKM